MTTLNGDRLILRKDEVSDIIQNWGITFSVLKHKEIRQETKWVKELFEQLPEVSSEELPGSLQDK